MFRNSLLALLLVAALCAPACLNAQATPQREPVPNFELYGGYSYVFHTINYTNSGVATSGMNGWDTSLKIPLPVFNSWLGLKGDVSGSYYKNNTPDFNPNAYFFLLGPQVSFHLGRSTLFVHGLVGSAHLNQEALPNLRDDNTLATAVGAGLDAGFSRHWGWRVTGDFYNTHFRSGNNTVQGITNSSGRVATGPVLRF
jgi:opacity protein-like surface antigen